MKFMAQVKNRLSWLLDRSFLGGVLVILLPFLQRMLYLKGLFYGRDFTEVIGARGYFYHQLRQGKLVLWDAAQATGIPFPTYLFDLFNPFSLLYTFLLQDGYLRSNPTQWMLTLHCSLGALGAYLLGLSLNLGRTAAVVMGVIMGCCGVVVIKSVEPMMVHTFAWAPFVFLFLHRARRRGLKREGIWAGVFLGFCFLGGHPQIFYYIGLAVLLYALYGLVVDTEESGAGAAWSLAFRTYLPLTISFLLTSAPQMAHELATLVWGPPDVLTSADTRTPFNPQPDRVGRLQSSLQLSFSGPGRGTWGNLLLCGHHAPGSGLGGGPLAAAPFRGRILEGAGPGLPDPDDGGKPGNSQDPGLCFARLQVLSSSQPLGLSGSPGGAGPGRVRSGPTALG